MPRGRPKKAELTTNGTVSEMTPTVSYVHPGQESRQEYIKRVATEALLRAIDAGLYNKESLSKAAFARATEMADYLGLED